MKENLKKIKSEKTKIITIVGTTASGKTTIGVRLARKFDGEIVSADSRQVYKGMDIGSGKDLNEYRINIASKGKRPKYVNIPYHVIDVVGPNTEFNLSKFQHHANKAIRDISAKKHIPIIVGGTGLYVQSLVDGFQVPVGKPDIRLRKSMEKLSLDDLLMKLSKISPKIAANMNNSDRHNKRRLVRYIEIAQKGEVFLQSKPDKTREFFVIGVTWPREELRKRIEKRNKLRLRNEDMLGEIERLHQAGVSWNRLISFGLEYKYLTLYLKGDIDYREMEEQLLNAVMQFAKRQITWLKRWERQGQKIHWVKTVREAENLAKAFLSN